MKFRKPIEVTLSCTYISKTESNLENTSNMQPDLTANPLLRAIMHMRRCTVNFALNTEQ